MTERIVTLPINSPDDVFALRQSGHAAAAAVGCDEVDQVRLATALSELGREALAYGAGTCAKFSLAGDGSLVVQIEHFSQAAISNQDSIAGLDAARRLIEDVTVGPDDGGSTVTVKIHRGTTLHHGTHSAKGKVNAASIRAAIARTAARGPLDELRLENSNLVATLDELKARQEQLVQLNAELEETNRGVLAMYAQLADELEETNRGVVALYADLDDKTVQLKAANDAKSRFLASVSHELRSPVNSILGLARLLLDPEAAAETDEQRKQLELILGSSHELLRLVNELLDLAKAESGRLQPDVTRVDLEVVFSELRGSLRPLAQPGVELIVGLEDPIAIETDRTLLVQVLRNLLTNALKFTTRGRVCLSAREATAYEIEISVSDTGIGIAPEDRAKVFEEFFQVRGPLQATHKGTGLGLPYARRVVETLGGAIRLESELAKGSTFTVKLPKIWQALLRASESPGRRPPASDVRIGTVLIVDDDETFRATLRGLLQGIAAQVVEAAGGLQGLELMRASPPDLAFLDLRMPDLSGTEVLAEMQSDVALRDIPAAVVTSAEISAEERAALKYAAAVLSKSALNRQDVQVVVSEALALKRVSA